MFNNDYFIKTREKMGKINIIRIGQNTVLKVCNGILQ